MEPQTEEPTVRKTFRNINMNLPSHSSLYSIEGSTPVVPTNSGTHMWHGCHMCIPNAAVRGGIILWMDACSCSCSLNNYEMYVYIASCSSPHLQVAPGYALNQLHYILGLQPPQIAHLHSKYTWQVSVYVNYSHVRRIAQISSACVPLLSCNR